MQTPSECALHLSQQKQKMTHRAGAELMIKSKYCLRSYCKRVDPTVTSN